MKTTDRILSPDSMSATIEVYSDPDNTGCERRMPLPDTESIIKGTILC
jgi:hypothetical protein